MMFVASPIGMQHWRERETERKQRLDWIGVVMICPLPFILVINPPECKVMHHQNETYSLVILCKRLQSLICYLFTYSVSPFFYFPSLINPINTNVDKIFHFVFIQTGPVQFWHSNSWFYLHMLLICYYSYSYEHLFTIPLPNFHVNHYWFLK